MKLKRVVQRVIQNLKNQGKFQTQFQSFFNQNVRKLYRKRKYIIKEIIETEQRYVADLKLAYEYVVEEFIRRFDQNEARRVFSNLKEIIQVNEQLMNKLQIRVELENRKYKQKYKLDYDLENYYGHENSILFSVKQNQELFTNFESYFEYCEKYEQCKKIRIDLEKNNETFMQIVRNAKQRLNNAQFDLEDYLSKPFQRLPRYILLLGDLKKNTPSIINSQYLSDPKQFYHPDYDNIVNLIENFEILTQKNNEKIGEFQDTQKMIDIQQNYGSDRLILHNNKRKFIFEENVEYYINSKTQKSIILICFDDSILLMQKEYNLIGQSKKKFIGMNEFSLASEITRIDSNKGCMFKLTTKQKVFIFIASDEQQFIKIEKNIKQCIDDFVQQKKNLLEVSSSQDNLSWDNAKIIVSVEGTEEFDIASINNYTVYIIKLQLQNIEWKVYKRYKSLQELYKFVLKHDSKSKFVKLQKSNWLRIHDNKYLDAVKINIEGFIQSIFQWEKFEKYKRQILTALGLPHNFNLLPLFFEQQIEVTGSRSMLQQIVENDDESNVLISDQLNQKFLEELKITKILTEIIKKTDNKEFIRQIKIQIPNYVLYQNPQDYNIFKQGECIIEIDSLMKAIEVCEKIAEKIKLQSYYDFRLVVIDSRNNQRVLENNQIVLQSLPQDKNIFENQESSLANYSVFDIFEDVQYHLYFQKYIFFPVSIERQLYIRDQVRLLMLLNYFMRELKNYQLNLSDYSLVYALFVIIFRDRTNKEFHINTDDLDNLITQKIRKSQMNQTWKKLTEKYLQNLQPELKQILQIHLEKSFAGPNQITPTIQNLATIMMIDFAFSLPLFGLVFFYVGINMRDQTNKSIEQFLQNEIPNLYLGISYNSLHFLSPGNRRLLYTFPLINIKLIRVEPVYLHLEIEHIEQNNLKMVFKTSEGYKISQLIKEYQGYCLIGIDKQE